MSTRTWRRFPGYVMAAAVLGAALLSACRGPLAAGAEAPAATVNGQAITEGQVRQALLAQFGARTLVRMIDTELVRQAAKAGNLSADPGELKVKLDSSLAQAGGEAAFEKSLAAQNLTPAEFRDRLAVSLLLDALALQDTVITDAQVQAYYQANLARFSYGDQVHARMILTGTQENAASLRSALTAGGDFAGLAQAFSEDPATKAKGGDMGWFERGDYAAEISGQAFSLALKTLSPVFKGPDGYYLIEVLEKRPAAHKPVAEVRGEIVSALRYDGLPQARQKWMQTARQGVQITIADPEFVAVVKEQLKSAPPLGGIGMLPGTS